MYDVKRIVSFFNRGEERTILVKRNIAFSFFIKFIGILISLQMIPMTIDYINPTQYGIWLTLSSIIGWIAYFDMGFAHGFRNKFAEAKAEGNILLTKKYVSTTYAVLSMIFGVIFVIVSIVNFNISWGAILNVGCVMDNELSCVFFILICFFCLQIILNVLTALLMADQKSAFSSAINTIGQFLALGVIFILVNTTTGNLIKLALVLSGIPCVFLLIVSFYMYKSRYRYCAPSIKYIDLGLTRNIVGLGGKFFVIQISMLVIFQFTNIILSRLQGPGAVTEYNIAYRYFGVIHMVSTIILSPFWSAFTDAYTKKDFLWMKKAYSKLSKIWLFAILGCIIMLVISPWVYRLWLRETVIIPFSLSLSMCIYVLVLSRASLYMQLINGIGKVFVQLIIYAIFSVIAIPLMILLCKMFGTIGVVFVSIFVFLIQCIFSHIQLNKLVNGTACGLWNK